MKNATKNTTIYNFHLPLPAHLYQALTEQAEKANRPATKIAREAIEDWLKKEKQAVLHEQISHYAQTHARSLEDLDEPLEATSIEMLMKGKRKRK